MAHRIDKRLNVEGVARYTVMVKTPAGTWRGVGTFGDKRQAKREAIKAEEQVAAVDWTDSREVPTLRQYFEHVYWPQRGVERTTMASEMSEFRCHILPTFGDKRLHAIKPSDVQGWINGMDKTGASPSSISKRVTHLRGLFNLAVEDRVVSFNPATNRRKPKIMKPEVKILSPEQFDAMLSFLEPEAAARALVSIDTGMRWGEVIGLCPAQVNWLKKTISVDRTVTETSAELTGTGTRFARKPFPKGRRSRLIAVDQGLLDLLAAQMKARGLAPDSTAEFFIEHGTLGVSNHNNNLAMKAAMKKAGIEGCSYKHLRSSHASWALAGGATLRAVADRLGHAHVTTTEKYLASLPDADEATLAAFRSVRRRSS